MLPSLELMRKLLGGNSCFTECFTKSLKLGWQRWTSACIYELIWIVVLWDIGDSADVFLSSVPKFVGVDKPFLSCLDNCYRKVLKC